MSKLAAPDEVPPADITAEALAGWGKTARLAVIRLSESVGPAVTLLLAWMARR